MELESSRSGTEFMTMLITMTLEILKGVQLMSGQSLEDLQSILIRVEEELADHQQKLVTHFYITLIFYYKAYQFSVCLISSNFEQILILRVVFHC